MPRLKQAFVVFLWAILCLPVLQHGASAQVNAETGLDLEEAVSLALQHNLNLKKNEIDLAASGYSESRLWAEIFPTINASLGTSYSNTLFSVPASGPGASSSGPLTYSMGFSVSLGLNAGIPYSIKNLQLAHQGNILRYEDAGNQLSIQITKRFYALVAEKRNLALLEEILSLAQRQYERSEVSFRNGLVGELALLQSRLSVENARFNLSAANTTYANNMGEFLAMLGITDTDVTLSGEINIVRIEADAQVLIDQHLHRRPDIVRNLQEIERLENAERQAFMQSRAPSLNLSMSWNISNFNPYTDRFQGSANLTIPIDSWIPGTSRNQSVRRANDSIEKARLDLAITEDAARTQIRSLTALLRNSWNSISIARLSLEAAQRSYQLTDAGFRTGTIEYLTLEDARNNMANARQRVLQSELSYFNMILDLCAALNVDWKNFILAFGVPGEEE